MRILTISAIAGLLLVAPARAQAPSAGPLVLLLPVSSRSVGLGNTDIRDDYSVFSDPAKITPTNGIGATFARYGSNATLGAVAAAVNVGPLNYGWGVELVQYRAGAASAYPFAPAELAMDGVRPAISLAAVAAAEYTFKGFPIGLSLKYTEDRVDAANASFANPVASAAVEHGLLLADIGVAHPLAGGTAALVVQNIGGSSYCPTPTLTKVSYSRSISTKQLDFALAAQLSDRHGWIGGGGGGEVGWGWIEGWSAALRAGAHRVETDGQKPISVGGTLNADRLVLDYALEFFDGNKYAHHISVRWR